MRAYKGFNGDLACTCGKGTFSYAIGETITEDSSKCASRGMHCAEYILDCMAWYPLGRGNRYCEVEALGSIDEDGRDTKIACTKMRIVRELSLRQIAAAAVIYMVQHPDRDWERKGNCLEAAGRKAAGQGAGALAIARGKSPRVKGKAGSTLALVREPERGIFDAVQIFEVAGEIRENTWYTIDENGGIAEG